MKQQKIGIMADSHGRCDAITVALDFFVLQKCDAVYHLGDICDSVHPETADDCVALLRQHNVIGIKGNNDHLLVVNHEGRRISSVSTETLNYLKHLPLMIHHGEIILAHSLPFVKDRGLSCMVGVLGPAEASLFFREYPHSMLIRGHNHVPEVLWPDSTVAAQSLSPNQKIEVENRMPCIVTCGALDHGFCMIWDADKQLISCHGFR